MDVPVSHTEWSSFQPLQSVEICSAKSSSAKPDALISETRGSGISKSLNNLGETTTAEPDDWRTPLVHYLENPGHIVDRKFRQQALKYVMLDNSLYRRTID
jgi:hypothetical protein